MSAAITNPLLQVVVSARGVSEVRDDFSTVVNTCCGQLRVISSAKGSRVLRRIRHRERKQAHPGEGLRSSSHIEAPHDI
jgi:hypothetical protein